MNNDYPYIFEIIQYVATFSILIPFCLGAYAYSRLTKPLKFLFLSVITSVLFEATTFTLYLYCANNLFLFGSFNIVNLCSLSLVFYHLLERARFKWLVLSVTTITSIYFSYCYLIYDDILVDAENKAITSIVISVYCILYLLTSVDKLNVRRIEKHPYFIFIAGSLIYFLGTLFVFFLIPRIASNKSYMLSWGIHCALNIVVNISYSYSLFRGFSFLKRDS